jgi:hypothetical protein
MSSSFPSDIACDYTILSNEARAVYKTALLLPHTRLKQGAAVNHPTYSHLPLP